MSRYLACLRALVIAVCSSAARTTSLRGNVTWAVHRIGYVIRPYDMIADRRRWFWQPRLRCGWSLTSVRDVTKEPTVIRLSTALGTTPTTSGSPRPTSGDGDNLAPLLVPISQGPYRNLSRSSERAPTTVHTTAVQHNPRSARIDASSYKQFGMCDYPRKRKTRPEGVDTQPPDA
jgi:hypothetical protein